MENVENQLVSQDRKRLTVAEIKEEVLSQFYLEKGLFFTFLQMLKNPKHLVDLYLYEDRKRVFNPFRYLLFAVAASTFIMLANPGFRKFIEDIQHTNFDIMQDLGKKLDLPIWETMIRSQELYMSYQNVVIILSIPVISWITRALFSKTKYNFAENMAVNSFVFGTTYWISTLIGAITYFTTLSAMGSIATSILTIIFGSYLYFKIFKTSILKAFGGMLLVYIPVMIIGGIFQILMFATILMTL